MLTLAIEPIICHKLHRQDAGCTQEIPRGAGWSYCPLCGRSTGHILALQTDGKFKAPKQQSSVSSLTLRNVGLTPVKVELSLEMPMPGVKLPARQQRQLTVAPTTPQRVEIELPPLERSAPSLGKLLVRSQDAEFKNDNEYWQERRKREDRIPLSVEVDTPAQVTPIEEIALFRYDVPERSITLVNEGSSAAEILDIEAPEGYEVAWPSSDRTLASRQPMTLQVRRLWHIPAEPEAPLRIRTANDTRTVTLHTVAAEAIRSRPFAIIGIDFGTTYSTIAFRECRDHPTVPDEVEFLTLAGEDTVRFPTVVWIGNMGEMEFGSIAEQRYTEDPTQGVLLREIKTLLRDPHKAAIYPKRRVQEGRRLLARHFGDEWGEALVTEYLRWLYQGRILPELETRFNDRHAKVEYVFSLPVLDKGVGAQPQYEQQLEAMRRCIQNAGFPIQTDERLNRVEFALEPACAALGLLHPPRDVTTGSVGRPDSNSWPMLGTERYPVKNGVTLAVFDSGGGTTDVIVGHVEEAAGARGTRLSLTIESALGVGSEAETFGGEWVTKSMTSLLDNPNQSTLEFEGENLGTNPVLKEDGTLIDDWFVGDTSFVGLRVTTGSSEYEEAASAEMDRDKVEAAKRQLAAEEEVEVQGVGGSTTRIQPRLLPRLIQPRLLSLSDELEARVFDAKQRAATNYYVFVGGNTRIPFVRRWAQSIMNDRNPDAGNRRLLLPDRYLQLAVAHGAAWIPDARVRNAAPYDVTIKVEDETLMTLPRNQSQDNARRSDRYPLPPGATATVVALARLHANGSEEAAPDARVCRAQISRTDVDNNPAYGKYRNQMLHIRVVASLNAGVLRVSYGPEDPEAPRAEVPLTPLMEYKL